MAEEKIIDIKKRVCIAGRKSVEELIKVAEESIIHGRLADGDGDDLSADKLTRAAQAKKIAIMDAFEILEKVEQVENDIAETEGSGGAKEKIPMSPAESRANRRQ